MQLKGDIDFSARGRVVSTIVMLGAIATFAFAMAQEGSGRSSSVHSAAAKVMPLDDVMHYAVSFAGIRCGSMTLQSLAESTPEGDVVRIVMTARSSKFFDSIYRVRSTIESTFSPSRMSSIRYHEHSQEKKKTNDKLYLVDFDNSQVRRIENDEERLIPINSDQVYDPLAFLYRVRKLVDEPGDSVVLTMVTSDGDLDTVAEVMEQRHIKTPFGKREAIRVVPRPKDEMLFSKKGSMSVYLSTDDRKIPYRIEFELSFGKLTAKLKSIDE